MKMKQLKTLREVKALFDAGTLSDGDFLVFDKGEVFLHTHKPYCYGEKCDDVVWWLLKEWGLPGEEA